MLYPYDRAQQRRCDVGGFVVAGLTLDAITGPALIRFLHHPEAPA